MCKVINAVAIYDTSYNMYCPATSMLTNLHWLLIATSVILIININLIYLSGNIIMYNGYKREFCALIISAL